MFGNSAKYSVARLKCRGKQMLVKATHSVGWEIRRRQTGQEWIPASGTALETAMMSLLSVSGYIYVVQVGANDGQVNDPIHKFVQKYAQSTSVLLIEPQEFLLPVLKENYRDHPSHVVVNAAIGAPGSLDLYAVDPSVWVDCVVPYAQGWPVYRAPSGITSANQRHVTDWLSRHYRGHESPESLVKRIEVPSIPLTELLDRINYPKRIDVLQVDAESMDDEVIYASSLEATMPAIVNFEISSLPRGRLERLVTFLDSLGYEVCSTGQDALAIRMGSES